MQQQVFKTPPESLLRRMEGGFVRKRPKSPDLEQDCRQLLAQSRHSAAFGRNQKRITTEAQRQRECQVFAIPGTQSQVSPRCHGSKLGYVPELLGGTHSGDMTRFAGAQRRATNRDRVPGMQRFFAARQKFRDSSTEAFRTATNRRLQARASRTTLGFASTVLLRRRSGRFSWCPGAERNQTEIQEPISEKIFAVRQENED